MGDTILKEDEDLPPKDVKSLFGPLECKLCGVKSESTLAAMSHYKGRPHAKKLNAYLRTTEGVAPETPKRLRTVKQNFCELCGVVLTSDIQRDQHYAGKSHAKNLQAASSGAPPKIATLPPTKHDPTGRFGIGVSFIGEERVEPSVSHPKPPSPQPLLPDFYCYICDVPTTGADQLEAHVKGARHSKKLKKQADKTRIVTHVRNLTRYRTPSDNYYCPQCNITSNSSEQFIQHMDSKKHKRNIQCPNLYIALEDSKEK